MRWRMIAIVGAARRLSSRLGILAWLALIVAAPAAAEKRVALVVGNSAYRNVTPLDNPANDAKLMASTLRGIGFTLVGDGAQLDLDKAALDNAVQSFSTQIQGADVGLFYYAGHGVQLRGANYLVPVNANLTREADVDFQLVDTELVLRQMEGAGTKLNIVILDACRNNPFGGRGLRATTGGLAQMQAPEGTLISYATQPGNVAQDGAEGNSPFTKALAATIRKPGLGIFDAFNEVGLVVKRSTGGAQQPWVSSSPIDGSFFFSGAPSAPAQAGSPGATADEATWGFVKDTKDPDELRRFIEQFPASARRVEAASRLIALEQAKAQTQIAAVAPTIPSASVQPTVVPPPARPAALPAGAQDTIKVGILHSLSGTMAISEAALKDVMLMLIDEQNRKGGLLGRKLEAVVVDPASNWPLFAAKARELIATDKVAAVFGCWTSVSRKSVLPAFKELDSILFYPVQYEGEESERNVFYTGAAPNQQAIPAVDYLMKEEKVQRFVLAGTDYVYPRTTNLILQAYLKSKGVADADIMVNYTPFGFSDWRTIVSDIKKFGSAGKKTAVVSTINGDANVAFYRQLGSQGIRAADIPVVALSVGEQELAGIDPRPLVGQLAAWSYFQSIDTPANREFVARWKTGNPKRVSNDPMEAHVIGFAMWVEAVKKAGTTDPDRVIDALPGIKVPNLTGGTAEMLPNHHITKPAFIGEVRADGQFDVVWKSGGLVPGDAWSPYLAGSKDLVADWVKLKCGNYNTVTRKCGGA
jgi:urea transport system substrate-binding protein